MERMLVFADLARRHPEATLVFSGGSGEVFAQDYKEATVAREISARLGVPEGRVVWEAESRNTYENAVLGRALVRPAAGTTWLLVTSAQHMPRAVGTVRAAVWPVA